MLRGYGFVFGSAVEIHKISEYNTQMPSGLKRWRHQGRWQVNAEIGKDDGAIQERFLWCPAPELFWTFHKHIRKIETFRNREKSCTSVSHVPMTRVFSWDHRPRVPDTVYRCQSPGCQQKRSQYECMICCSGYCNGLCQHSTYVNCQ